MKFRKEKNPTNTTSDEKEQKMSPARRRTLMAMGAIVAGTSVLGACANAPEAPAPVTVTVEAPAPGASASEQQEAPAPAPETSAESTAESPSETSTGDEDPDKTARETPFETDDQGIIAGRRIHPDWRVDQTRHQEALRFADSLKADDLLNVQVPQVGYDPDAFPTVDGKERKALTVDLSIKKGDKYEDSLISQKEYLDSNNSTAESIDFDTMAIDVTYDGKPANISIPEDNLDPQTAGLLKGLLGKEQGKASVNWDVKTSNYFDVIIDDEDGKLEDGVHELSFTSKVKGMHVLNAEGRSTPRDVVDDPSVYYVVVENGEFVRTTTMPDGSDQNLQGGQ